MSHRRRLLTTPSLPTGPCRTLRLECSANTAFDTNEASWLINSGGYGLISTIMSDPDLVATAYQLDIEERLTEASDLYQQIIHEEAVPSVDVITSFAVMVFSDSFMCGSTLPQHLMIPTLKEGLWTHKNHPELRFWLMWIDYFQFQQEFGGESFIRQYHRELVELLLDPRSNNVPLLAYACFADAKTPEGVFAAEMARQYLPEIEALVEQCRSFPIEKHRYMQTFLTQVPQALEQVDQRFGTRRPGVEYPAGCLGWLVGH